MLLAHQVGEYYKDLQALPRGDRRRVCHSALDEYIPVRGSAHPFALSATTQTQHLRGKRQLIRARQRAILTPYSPDLDKSALITTGSRLGFVRQTARLEPPGQRELGSRTRY